MHARMHAHVMHAPCPGPAASEGRQEAPRARFAEPVRAQVEDRERARGAARDALARERVRAGRELSAGDSGGGTQVEDGVLTIVVHGDTT